MLVSISYLAAFVEKWVPDAEEYVDRETVDEENKEPVEREEWQITLMCREVTVERRQLLRHDVFQHSLKHTHHMDRQTDW